METIDNATRTCLYNDTTSILHVHVHYLIGSGDASLLVNDGLNDEDSQGFPPSVVKEGVDRGEVRELEDGEGILVRLDWHLHQPDQLMRHAGHDVDTVGGVWEEMGQVKFPGYK